MTDIDRPPPPRIAVPITEEIIEDILDAVASGSTLRAACNRPGYPRPNSFRAVLKANPELQARYEASKSEGKSLRKVSPGVKITDEVLADCVQALAAGQTLVDFCAEPGRPCRRAIVRAVMRSDHWIERLRLARDCGYDALAEETIRLADAPIPTDDYGKVDRGVVAQRRLQIDTRLKLLSKWATAKYGDKIQVDGAGGVAIQVVTGVDAGASLKSIPHTVRPSSEKPPTIEVEATTPTENDS